MSEPQPVLDLQGIFTAVVGALVAILAWLGKRLHNRVDQSISRDEFNDALREFRDERRQMHDENRETLNRIHERVDQLWERR